MFPTIDEIKAHDKCILKHLHALEEAVSDAVLVCSHAITRQNLDAKFTAQAIVTVLLVGAARQAYFVASESGIKVDSDAFLKRSAEALDATFARVGGGATRLD